MTVVQTIIVVLRNMTTVCSYLQVTTAIYNNDDS